MVWDVSHSASAAQLTRVYFAGPVNLVLRIAFVLVLALIIRATTHRIIDRVIRQAANSSLPERLRRKPGGLRLPGRSARKALTHFGHPGDHPAGSGAKPPASEPGAGALIAQANERRHQRVHALGSILGSGASIAIFGVAGMTILGDLGVNLAPILASAGVLGVALGFGAQSLVGDFLAGISMLLEDQYGVGDVINVGVATGTVEAVGLRITTLRDVNGVVWHVRNGTLQSVGNQSQGWSRAVVDFPIPYSQDISEIREIMTEVIAEMWAEPEWQGLILEEPQVWGIQSLSSSEVVWRLVAMTSPLRQPDVERELRERIKVTLDAHGITTAPAMVSVTGAGSAQESAAAAASTAMTSSSAPPPSATP
jgi:small conductance mechanosensitive channel